MPQPPAYKIVIPARYASQRLPAKPLLRIAEKTVLEHVFHCASRTSAEQIVIATDDQRIVDEASRFAEHVCLTSPNHPTGTDRIAEVVDHYAWPADAIIVNLQGDEPLMPVVLMEQVAANLHHHPAASIATLCAPLANRAERNNPAIVKVVFDRQQMALYFSRAAIPFARDAHSDSPPTVFRHIGLYAYRAHFLQEFRQTGECDLEQWEKLEQLRALWNGYKIHVDQALQAPGQDINTQEDFLRVATILLEERVVSGPP